jgi:hypothetical protein
LNQINITRIVLSIIFIHTLLSDANAQSRYLPLERGLYLQYEYLLLMEPEQALFIMNQPYEFNKLDQVEHRYLSKKTHSLLSETVQSEEGLSILVQPGYALSKNNKTISYPSADIGGYFKVGNIIGVSKLYASKHLAQDPDYHGDIREWVSAYMYDAYLRFKPYSKLAVFLGRTSRNYGIPNEYSLFLSNNPYPYDHFGLSVGGDVLKFSWYHGRLNDMLGYDDDGLVIPIGEKKLVQRYMAYQRLDWKINATTQISFSEATLYGGPGQSMVSSYLNPLNFYYLSQRNQQIQMNGAWQINFFCYRPRKWAWYTDFYIDDFIINNDEGVNDRARYPDRLAIMSKISFPNIIVSPTLSTVRYVRIWNETYVTFRNYENWTYYNKGLGFPDRSYEGFRYEITYFGAKKYQLSSSLEGWRKGDRILSTTMIADAKVKFPASPVTRGITSINSIEYVNSQIYVKLGIKYEIYQFESESIEPETVIDFTLKYRLNAKTKN